MTADIKFAAHLIFLLLDLHKLVGGLFAHRALEIGGVVVY